MKVELLIAGASCFACALGHATIGLRWVLPNLATQPLSGTPFGPPARTHAMLRLTWHIVTLMLLGFGTLMMTLASDATADVRMLTLRWLAVLWLTVTALMLWSARHRLRGLLRLPVPALTLLVAAMCWKASG